MSDPKTTAPAKTDDSARNIANSPPIGTKPDPPKKGVMDGTEKQGSSVGRNANTTPGAGVPH